jgi:TPR repeat protein
MRPAYFRLLILVMLFNTAACAHFGLDSEADIAAENCYAYRYGDKIRRINFSHAFDWCFRSARWGNANSQTLLAELYYLGLGGKQDKQQAQQWYEKAARQGHAHAQYMLYRLYRHSHDWAQQQQAGYWLKQATYSGYKLALQEAEIRYER